MTTRQQNSRKNETPSPLSKLFPGGNSSALANALSNSESNGMKDNLMANFKPHGSDVFMQPSVATTTAEKT